MTTTKTPVRPIPDVSAPVKAPAPQPGPPAGYWQDANGYLVPESKVKPIDQLRHQLVQELCREAQYFSVELAAYKAHAMAEVSAFVDSFSKRQRVQHELNCAVEQALRNQGILV